MKKLFVFAIILNIILPSFSKAAFLAPYLDINVTVNTSGGDSNFFFHINAGYPLDFSQDFQIQTQSGTGSYLISTNTSNGAYYYLSSLLQTGWQFESASCTSDNSQINTFPVENGVGIQVNPYSKLNCVFNEKKSAGKTPVLIIPGTLGTEIWKGEDKLWPDIDRMVKRSDSFMDPLAFKSDGTPLDTSLSLGKVLSKPHESFDYTESLVTDLHNQGYIDNQSLFLFPYDWRNDITKNSDLFLKNRVDSILASSSLPSLDVIAHSQGGLLIKKLLFDHPEYNTKINKVIFVGTPNLGAPKTAKILIYGDDFNIKKFGIFGLDPLEIKKISTDMPSIYQMLPSRAYFDHSNGYLGEYAYGPIFASGKVYNSFEDSKNILKKPGYGLNTSLIESADEFHSLAFDNFDFTGTGVHAFNLIGCESATIGKIFINGVGKKDDINYEPGDGTVPLVSASNIGGAQNSFILKKNDLHSVMLSTDSVRQKIVNILNNDGNSVAGITSNPALCVLNGKKVEVHSPVDMHIYDESGKHVGPRLDGGFDYEIEGIQYDEIDHNKYAFLPDDGHTYTVKLIATDKGSFNFYSTSIKDSETENISYYSNVPITSTSTAQVLLNEQNDQNIEFTSDNRVVPPSSILNPTQSQDLTPPISTSTLTGLMGNPGYYRSDVGIKLSAFDPVTLGHESETSGLLKSQYSLDNQAYQPYSTSTPITVTTEGSHTLKFFSTDRAGNNEPEQTISFSIDKTEPEISMQFDPNIKDLKFSAVDRPMASSSTTTITTILDNDDTVTASDLSGNQTVLRLKDKNRKNSMKAEIKSLSYNGKIMDLSKNMLHFDWLFDKKNNLQVLSQIIQSKNNFNVLSSYALGRTIITGRDQSGKLSKLIKGLEFIRVITKNGDLGWSY